MGSPPVREPRSITHVHLAAIINTEVCDADAPIRVLDAGCGDGQMLEYLIGALSEARPHMDYEFYGFDVGDSAVQSDPAFLTGAQRRLAAAAPGVDWRGRLTVINSGDQWPYADGFFDVIVSNQVLEHVTDLDRFLTEVSRTLAPAGASAHIFPLRAVVNEGHVRVPFAHRIVNHDVSRAYLEAANRLGIGRYGTYNIPGDDRRQFAQREADRLWYYTRYRSYTDVLGAGRRAGLRASFRYTPELYRAKVRSLMGRQPRFTYTRHTLTDWVAARVLQYVSGVTLFLEKRNDVRPVPEPYS